MQRERQKRGCGGWLFLLMVLAAYGIAGVFDAETAQEALAFFGKILRQVIPALALVFLLLLACNLLIKPEWIRRNLGSDSGLKGWLIAAVGGVLATGSIYAWYALLRELREKGMRSSLAAVFLYSRAVKLPLLPLMIHYFGAMYTVVLCLYLLGFSFVSGMLMLTFEPREVT